MKTNKLYYRYLDPCGLFNHVLSLETAVGIQHKTNSDIIFYNDNFNDFFLNKPSNYDNKYSDMIARLKKQRIDDFFTWDSQDRFIFDYDIKRDKLQNIKTYDMFNIFLVDKNKTIKDINEFACNRSPVYFDETEINLKNTLVSYSYFFYHRDIELDTKIGSVSAKKEYKELAKKIADSLEDFDGIHLRMTDFSTYFYTVTQDMFNEAIKSFNSGRKIVISTDDPESSILKGIDNSVILLDKYIYENFFDDFKSLPIHDEIIFGLINNLVMHYSKDFIGTLGSSFTSYIQKNRINMGLNESFKWFNNLNYKKTENYSWTNSSIPDKMKSCWREWEECLLIKD
jgi:hypothetical protein